MTNQYSASVTCQTSLTLLSHFPKNTAAPVRDRSATHTAIDRGKINEDAKTYAAQ